jgi:protein-tyrosine phosphatase
MSTDNDLVVLVVVIAALVLLVWLLTIPFHALAPRCLQFAWSHVIRACKGYKKKPWSTDAIFDTQTQGATLVLGSMPQTQAQLQELASHHGDKLAIVSMNATWELLLQDSDLQAMGIDLLRLPTPDFFAPSPPDIDKGIAFIEKQLSLGISVLCHCHAGRGRSAVMVICFLMEHCGMNLSDALAHVKARRKIANLDVCCGLRPQWRACRGFERRLHSQGKTNHKANEQNNWAEEVHVGPAKIGSAKVGVQP